ncbi:MAG: hypothetical protein N3B01_09295 [Verrucomicrobiae bacterium]|nr:hypothetical protein [Verrucomicrobiae bacterium]
MSIPVTRREFMASAAALSATALVSCATNRAGSRPRNMAETGWCWDGQGFNGGVNPSIFGAGEGTRWFGLNKVCFMFHPNTPLAMEKLRGFKEVVCEISKWKVRRCENGVAHYLDGSIQTKTEEAANVSRLSRQYPFITGAIDDDLLGIIKRDKIKPHQYGAVYRALKANNPKLKLWTVVYTHELKKESWAGFEPYMDVVNLWEWNAAKLPDLPRNVALCQELFPGKPIVLGCYLRDFPTKQGVPMKMLRGQWEFVRNALRDGTIQGYSILGGFLIDMHPEQAAWMRDFIKAN